MNRTGFRKAAWLLGTAAVLCVPLFVWMLSQERGGEMANGAVTRVTVILPHKDDGYWELIQDGLNAAEEKITGANRIDISTVIPQQNYSIPQMEDLVRQQMAAQVDFLVVQGNEDASFKETLLKAWEQGIQIICVDTDIADFPEHLYIGTDNYASGRMLGEALVELTDGKTSAAVMSGEPDYLNLQERLQGFLDATADAPGIVISEIQYNHYDGITALSQFQSMDEEADVMIFLEGTGGTTLSANVRSQAGYQYVLGFDAADNVLTGALDGVVRQETRQMGERVVEEIVRYVNTGSYSDEKIYTDIYWVTAENYETVMTGTGGK